MANVRRCHAALCVVVSLILAVPMHITGCSGPDNDARPDRARVSESPEQIRTIEALYERLAEYSRDHDGAGLKFRLDDFRHADASAFGTLRWLDVVTMPGGKMVDVTREGRTSVQGARTVRYAARWNRATDGAELPPLEGSPAAVSIAEALRRASETTPALGGVTSATTFRVTVELEGESREYRALVLWVKTPSSSAGSLDLELFAVDNITQGVHEVGVERGASLASDAAPKSAAGTPNAGAITISPTTCVPSTRSYTETQEQRKGKYLARAEFRGECSCDANCATHCSAAIVSKTCKYDHWSGFCRKMDESTEVSSALNEQGQAKCAAGLACAGKGCFLCLCFSTTVKATVKIIKISVLEVKVDFTFENASWKAGLKGEWTCADCRLLAGPTALRLRDRSESDSFSEGVDESVCGDTLCDGPENCSNCASDCGACPPVCGNHTCEAGESCSNCPADCGACPPVCGNHTCEAGETCSNCPADCICGPVCGDGVCAPGQEDCGTCLSDCPCWNPDFPICQNHQCVAGPVCGNGTCQAGENCGNCPADCGPCGPVCGDGVCAPGQEDCGTCLTDCPCWNPDFPICQNHQCVADVVCGNGVCQAGENCGNCPTDCGPCGPVCGDGVCAPGQEDCGNCLTDCPCWNPDFPICQNHQCVAVIECGNGVCEPNENCSTCAADCGMCSQCGNGTCEADEACWNCEPDCGYCSP